MSAGREGRGVAAEGGRTVGREGGGRRMWGGEGEAINERKSEGGAGDKRREGGYDRGAGEVGNEERDERVKGERETGSKGGKPGALVKGLEGGYEGLEKGSKSNRKRGVEECLWWWLPGDVPVSFSGCTENLFEGLQFDLESGLDNVVRVSSNVLDDIGNFTDWTLDLTTIPGSGHKTRHKRDVAQNKEIGGSKQEGMERGTGGRDEGEKGRVRGGVKSVRKDGGKNQRKGEREEGGGKRGGNQKRKFRETRREEGGNVGKKGRGLLGFLADWVVSLTGGRLGAHNSYTQRFKALKVQWVGDTKASLSLIIPLGICAPRLGEVGALGLPDGGLQGGGQALQGGCRKAE